MKKIVHYMMLGVVLVSFGTISSCSLEEENPSGFTMDAIAKTKSGYQTLVNQCYFAFERLFHGTNNWVTLTEGDTDLWTYVGNQSNTYTQWFWYFGGGSPTLDYMASWWNAAYDGIGSCNLVITLAHLAPYSESELNYRLAQARFMRAYYYFMAVQQWGGVTLTTEPPSGALGFEPERASQQQIYEEIIFPDLLFALEHLEKGTDALNTIPTKKAALGLLAKAYLQTLEWDSSKKYVAEALKYAEMLINDAEAGGATYGAYLYPTYDEVFAQANNQANKEALWKHRWYAGPDGHGSSNGNQNLNRNHEFFYCRYTDFGARVDIQESRITWGGNQPGIFMPSQHLLNLFVQSDGSLDPRFHKSFQTEWSANQDYTWDQGTVEKYDRDNSVVGKALKKETSDLAIKFIMPQDANYAVESANKLSRSYLVIDYKDVYDDTKKNVKMNYAYQNPRGNYKADGTSDNLFRYFYPSLTKFNSSNWYVVNASSRRNGNLNAILIMRTAEIYLLAAEAEFYLNGSTSKALGYINKVRTRAGAKPFTEAVSLRMILDERARELCGESVRFFDLKRTGMLKDNAYLQSTHPDLAQYFKPEYALRPIPKSYTDILKGGGAYYQNPGYN